LYPNPERLKVTTLLIFPMRRLTLPFGAGGKGSVGSLSGGGPGDWWLGVEEGEGRQFLVRKIGRWDEAQVGLFLT
jgi:hypothetical protein